MPQICERCKKYEHLHHDCQPEPVGINPAVASNGYVRAFDGTQVKRSCENCQQIYNDSDSYQPAWLRCSEYPFMENLVGFPFKNGCKYFELHWCYTEDYDERVASFTE